jgi:TonB family protein
MPADNAGGYAKSVETRRGRKYFFKVNALHLHLSKFTPVSMYRIIVLGISFLLMFSFAGIAQTDTVYYDRDWNQTDFSSADICRTLKVVDGNVFVEDHFYVKGIDTLYDHRPIFLKYPHYFYTQYTRKGNVLITEEYENNLQTGKETFYYPNTKVIWSECNYVKGKAMGELLSYYRSGKLKRKELHKPDDTTVTGACYDESGKEIAFTPFVVFARPTFDMPSFLGHNLHYPEYARENNIEGKVVISFMVNTDGSKSELKIIKRIGGGCEEEALRVMSQMPVWVPGVVDGAIAKMHYTQPIAFKLED